MDKVLDSFLPFLEKYILADDKQAYLKSLKADSKEKMFFEILLSTEELFNEDQLFKEKVQDKLDKIGIPKYYLQTFIKLKMQFMLANRGKDWDKFMTRMIREGAKNQNFDYPKPAVNTFYDNEAQTPDKKLQYKLTYPATKEEFLNKKLKDNQANITDLTEYGIKCLKEEDIKSLMPQWKAKLLLRHNLLSHYNERFITDLVTEIRPHLEKVGKRSEINSTFYEFFTKKQNDQYMKTYQKIIHDRSFITFWFKQNFLERLDKFQKNSLLSVSQKEAKRELLIEIRKTIEQIQSPHIKSLSDQTFMELLVLDLSLENPKTELFVQYLANIHIPVSHMNSGHQAKVSQRYQKSPDQGQFWHEIHGFEMATWSKDQLIQEYLLSLFKKHDDLGALIKQFQPYLQRIHLDKTAVRVRLLKGEDVDNLFSFLNQNEVKQLREKQKISILSKNKKYFKISDDVILATRVKNVKTIRIKLYELNLQQNYLQNQASFDENMNLTYLDPTNQFVYEVDNTNPFKQTIYDIPIKSIDKKPGVYIVELAGEGISTRAIIRKGAIVCLQKVTLAGVQLRFYDEDGNRIHDLDIWINGKKQKVKETFTIPYGTSNKTIKIVAVKDNFAELISIEVKGESYSWSLGYIYNSESFIVGNKAKIIIHPRLNLYGEPLPLNLLKDIKISVGMVNSQGIKSFLSFENVEFENNRDYVLEFPLQSYTQSINVTTKAEIALYSGKKQELSDTTNITICLNHNSDAFLKPYLKKVEGQYCLYILGRNGEPIPNQGIVLSLHTNLCNKPQQFHDAFTDNEGKIKLGKLPYFDSISARFNSSYNSDGGENYNFISNSARGGRCISWNLANDADVNFSQNLFYKKGETVDLPLSQTFDANQLIIEKLTGKDLVSEIITHLAIFEDGRLKIKDLPSGTYLIKFLKSSKSVKVIILEGKQWQAANQIYVKEESKVYELVRNVNQLANLGPALIQQQGDKLAVTVPISLPQEEESDSLRAHILISNYYDMEYEGVFNTSNFLVPKNPNKQQFKLKQCQFYNNKTLSDEENYVQNRQNQKKFVGNNLEKPRIFLKRLEVRNTTQQQQELQNQGSYNPVPSDALRRRQHQLHRELSRNRTMILNQLDSHNNFLHYPTITIGNLDGKSIKFNVPKSYSNFKIILLSHDSAIEKEYELRNPNPVERKDLRHRGLRDKSESQGWTMSRESYKICAGQSSKVNRNSHWCTVSASNVAAFAEIKGYPVPKWAQKWGTFSYEKKLEVYGDKFCHEINVYCHEHDRQFFDKIVKPFIANKITKTFVDLCLLEDESVKQFASIDKLQQLNEFEKILLIKHLVTHDGANRAKQIATAMESLEKSNKKSFEQFKRQFDTVIDAKKATQIDKMQKIREVQLDIDRQRYLEEQQRFYPLMLRFRASNINASNMSYDMMPMQQMSYMQQASPPPRMANRSIQRSYQAMPKMMAKSKANYDNFAFDVEEQMSKRDKFKKQFEQIQNTKQYTETNYTGVKNQKNTKNLVSPSPFWAQLALHIVNKETKPFISESFMYLTSEMQFTLAMCFLPNTMNADYDMKADEENIEIVAKSSFLIFVKEIKPTSYIKKFGVMINQRFFDPKDPYIYEDDGTQLEKQVEQFQIFKVYTSQTVITNTSGNTLELQILLDVPEGSVPLRSHQYTQITNIVLMPYTTQSFKRNFYFPANGKFNLYPANACRGKQIIAKGDAIQDIEVLKVSVKKNIKSFNDVIRMGNKQQILDFMAKKNVFDHKFFQPSSILWMLKDRQTYEKVIKLLKSRCFYSEEIWKFALFHEDYQTNLENFLIKTRDQFSSQLPIYQYFPYYSSRTHKFLNEAKSTIRNVQFKQNYTQFLLAGALQKPYSSQFKISMVYYLLLQDRIEEASTFFNKMTENQRKRHQIQVDYFECFLDMYSGYPTFAKARKISEYYTDYPIQAWRNLFKEVNDIVKQFDSTTYVQEQKKVQYSTTIIEQENNFKINIPPNTKISIEFYSVNLEFYFSKFPFGEIKSMTTIKPKKQICFEPGQYRQVEVQRPQDIKDVFVEVFQCSEDKSPSKVKAWHWVNPELKIRMQEKKGTAQAFFKGKQLSGCYCKVYSKNNSNSEKFYRDGYTDITGTFKYVLAGFEDIKEFSILFMSEHGGITMKAKPPSTEGTLI